MTGLLTYLHFFLKTTVWSYGEKVTDFHARKIPEGGSNYIFGQ